MQLYLLILSYWAFLSWTVFPSVSSARHVIEPISVLQDQVSSYIRIFAAGTDSDGHVISR